MDNKVLNYLAIAKKGRLVELGEEPVGAVARALKAHLIVVAADASDHTWRRAKSFAAGTDQQESEGVWRVSQITLMSLGRKFYL